MQLLKAIDQLDDHIHAAAGIPLTEQVRLEAGLLRASVSVIREEADKRFGTQRAGAIGTLFRALEELEALVASARSIPGSDQVRVSKARFYDRLDELRSSVAPAVRQQGGESGDVPPWAEVMDHLTALERLAHDAPRSTFARKLRIEAHELRDLAGRVRISATRALEPDAGREFFAALDRLDEIVRDGPQSGEIKVGPYAMYRILGEMRDALLAIAA
jgi:hypothetical protein